MIKKNNSIEKLIVKSQLSIYLLIMNNKFEQNNVHYC